MNSVLWGREGGQPTAQECWGQVWSTSGILMGPPDSFVSSRGREGGQKMDGGTGVLGASLVSIAHNQDTGPPSELYTYTLLQFIFLTLYMELRIWEILHPLKPGEEV